MKTKFDLFLEQSQFKEDILQKTLLEKVTVKKSSKTWLFHLKFERIMAPAILIKFLDQLESFFNIPKHVLKVDFKITYETYNLDDYAEDYYEYVIKKVSDHKASISVFKNYKPEYKDRIYTITVEKDGQGIKKYVPYICEHFKKIGFGVSLEVRASDTLETLSETIEAQIKEQAEHVSKQTQNVQKIVDKKVSFTVKSSPQAISINQIPMTQYEIDKYKNEKGDTNFLIEGEIFKYELRAVKNTNLLTMTVADDKDAIIVKRFVRGGKDLELAQSLKQGDFIQVSGVVNFDTFSNSVTMMASAIYNVERKVKDVRMDKAKEKRVEFHIHTKMSNMDAVTSAEEYIKTLVSWGHTAAAFTDHNGLYAFPDIHKASKGKDFKPIYGAQLDYVDETAFKFTSSTNNQIMLKDATYVVFDIETTGLSNTRDKIIELAAVKVVNGFITERYQSFVNPHEPLSEFTKGLTQITDEMVSDAPEIDDVIKEFNAFSKDAILVAQNASFDHGYIVEKMRQLNMEYIDFSVIDTLNIARYFYSDQLKRFNLKALARFFKVTLDSHHRAQDDAEATAHIFIAILQDLLKKDIKTYQDINKAIDLNEAWRYERPRHITVLAKNQVGYKNLFRVISDALTDHFHQGARTLKSVLLKHREGLLIGSACDGGEVFEIALNRSDEELIEAMKFYDYIEVNPPQAYAHLFKEISGDGREVICATIQKIINTAKRLNKLVIATSNAHYLNSEDKKYREIYIHTNSVGGGRHPLARYDVSPDQHLLTTSEMMLHFEFLGQALAEEIIITNTHKLNEMIDKIQAFPKDLYSIPDDAFKEQLGIDSIAKRLEEMVYEKAHSLYGKTLHPVVSQRLDKELSSIIKNEFAPIYFISHLLVKKSLDDGYLVGSRGSVGSSFVATMLDITEVNPLPPHYRCPKGDFVVVKMTEDEILEKGHSDIEAPFIEILKHVQSGYDLPDMVCPHCGEKLFKDGHDIPFETFLGFDGDKVPDIDLNFSGDYQSKAHAYVRELLGQDYTFRAGTIQTVAQRNAFGYVKGYLESQNLVVRDAQIERLASGIEGVRRSSGQHPGGIVVVPKSKEIFDVTPIQYPADDVTSEWKTTHFDYHSFEDNLLKLDILGHDDPTMIKFLMDYVEQHPDEFPFSRAQDIPLDDKKIYQLFASSDSIGISNDSFYGPVASYAIPEFGTPFTREMVTNTRPDTFAGLVKISGLSHGTDVWLGNSQALILGQTEFGKISFADVIGCRDDIMVYLSSLGMPALKAFQIMEFVRKGKPSKEPDKWQGFVNEMKAYKIPEWYIWSAGKIQYMFPKAHATAYVIMAMRIAWFKVYKPLLFYSGFLSKRAVQFDHEVMTTGTNAIRNKIMSIQQQGQLKIKDENLIVTLYIAYEMTKRGFKFLPVDIEKSAATTFIMEKDGLRMPFTSVDGLGDAVAYDIEDIRKQRAFTSKEDVKKRTRINKTVFDKMESYGAFNRLNEEEEGLTEGLFSDTFV